MCPGCGKVLGEIPGDGSQVSFGHCGGYGVLGGTLAGGVGGGVAMPNATVTIGPSAYPPVVWVVEQGVYEQRGVEGVYASLEAAIADHPVRAPRPTPYYHRWPTEREGGWQLQNDGSWSNGLDHDSAKTITPLPLRVVPDDDDTGAADAGTVAVRRAAAT
jgi:hypothetical protein